MSEKFYAVKKGYKTGIYNDYNSVRKQITGFKNPIFKKFSTIEEAEAFMNSGKKPKQPIINVNKKMVNDSDKVLKTINIWIGSNEDTQECFVCLSEDVEMKDYYIKKMKYEFAKIAKPIILNLYSLYMAFCLLTLKYDSETLKTNYHVVFHCKTNHVIDGFKKKYWEWTNRDSDESFKDYTKVFQLFQSFFENYKYSNLPKFTFVIDKYFNEFIEKYVNK